MQIQVFGSGCPTCKKLFETTQKAVEEMGLEAQVEYVSGPIAMQKIIELGALASPVLVIDGKLAMTGATLKAEKIKSLIQTYLK